MRNFLRLKLNFLILAQENVLIFVKFWKTNTPKCATERFKGTPSGSYIKIFLCVRIFYENIKIYSLPSLNAFWSHIIHTGVQSLINLNQLLRVIVLYKICLKILFNQQLYLKKTYICLLWLSIILISISLSWWGTNLCEDK